MAGKIKHILIGWGKRFGFLPTSEAEAALSALRLTICTGCSYSKPSTMLELVNGEVKHENILKCTECHCPCLQKSLVVAEKCPIGRW